MSASALLVVHGLMRSFVRDRSGSSAFSALWCQFPAHDRPRADKKGDADNRRRGERGEILQHERYLDPCGQSRSAAFGAGMSRRPGTAGDVPALGTLPAVRKAPTGRTACPRGSRGRAPAAAPVPRAYNRSSIRVFPKVLGFTRSRSRNSATPSS
jgi:hypothetical protein